MSCVPWKAGWFNRDSMGSHPKLALTGHVILSKSVTHCKTQAPSLIAGSDNSYMSSAWCIVGCSRNVSFFKLHYLRVLQDMKSQAFCVLTDPVQLSEHLWYLKALICVFTCSIFLPPPPTPPHPVQTGSSLWACLINLCNFSAQHRAWLGEKAA